ncbi:hypothetical protein GF325_07810 [Candidatus Bathyarchaeota archaeon]|nr:hypothetical protein [Candidatus Bathyarchaeota archaeon]
MNMIRNKKSRIAFIVVAVMIPVLASSASAQSTSLKILWDADGIHAGNHADSIHELVATSDLDGGIFLAWVNDHISSNVYFQAVDENGNIPLGLNGKAVCEAMGEQNSVDIISDGSGGAIIAWLDVRGTNSTIYTQRVDSSGDAYWTDQGVRVCHNPAEINEFSMDGDGSGGAYFTWQDKRLGAGSVYAQHVNASGGLSWGTQGAVVNDAPNWQKEPCITANGTNGAWVGYINANSGWNRVYVDYLNMTGGEELSLPLTLGGTDASGLDITADGMNGAAIAFGYNSSGSSTEYDIVVARVNATGLDWMVNACTAVDHQALPFLLAPGDGSVIVSWKDYRDSLMYETKYAQKFTLAGVPSWQANGTRIMESSTVISGSHGCLGGNGTAFFTWSNSFDIFIQQVNASGSLTWGTGGFSILNGTTQNYDPIVVPDTLGGIIIAWRGRISSDFQALVQRVGHGAGNGMDFTWLIYFLIPLGIAIVLGVVGLVLKKRKK